MEEKITNEEIKVTEDEQVVEELAADAPAAEEPIVEELAADAAEEPQAEETAEEEPLTDDDLKKFADDMVSKIKEIVEEGNVNRIRIRTVLGLAAAPWAVILGAISTVGFKCTVEIVKKDGTITVIHGKES